MTDRPIAAPASGQDQPLAPADVSQLVAVTLRLAMELTALRERLLTHEALLARHGLLDAAVVDAYRPDADETRSRLQQARELIESLSRDLGAPR